MINASNLYKNWLKNKPELSITVNVPHSMLINVHVLLNTCMHIIWIKIKHYLKKLWKHSSDHVNKFILGEHGNKGKNEKILLLKNQQQKIFHIMYSS